MHAIVTSAHREFINEIPTQLLGEKASNATLSHDLGQLARISKGVRKPELF